VLAAVPLPNPNPTVLKVLLAGDADSVTADIYSTSLMRTDTVSTGPAQAGWITLPLPSGFLMGKANGLYYFRVISIRGSNDSKPKVGRLMILR
jgi:hypothetical protein